MQLAGIKTNKVTRKPYPVPYILEVTIDICVNLSQPPTSLNQVQPPTRVV